MLPALSLLGLAGQANLRTPYASTEPLRLGALAVPDTVTRYAVVTLDLDASGTYNDPFDPAQVHLDATLVGPDGRTLKIPGYLDRPYRRELAAEGEKLVPEGPARWRLRIAPEQEGEYRLRVVFADRTGERVQNAVFRCVPSEDRGFVRLDESDHRYFSFSNGSSYWPLGTNLAWAGARGTYDYDDWLARLGEHGANYVRLWLGPSWATFANETAGRREEGKGVGAIDLANAWRLDHVLEQARAKGIYATLCLDTFGELKQSGTDAWWDGTPHNSDGGGPLRIWREFWSSETMDRLYRNRLRYLVARYGADSHVFAWEFWNEVDRVSEFDATTVRDWHARMAKALAELDAYAHPRSTSVSPIVGLRSVDLSPGLDFMQTHIVDTADPALATASQQSRKSGWGRAHMVGMVAASSAGPRLDVDPEGLQAHDPIWASIGTGSSGGAVPWWWQAMLGAQGPLAVYDAPSRFLTGVNWAQERFRQTDVSLSLVTKQELAYGDLVLDGGTVERPQATVVSNGVLMGEMPSGILHGTVVHPERHNPLTIRVRVARATRFEVAVSTVSGNGGASLKIRVDGNPTLSRDFADPEPNSTEDLTQYAGVLPVTLTPGVHTIQVENTGVDWVRVGYRLVGVIPRKGPPLNAWAVTGDGTAMAWLRNSGRSWRAVAEGKKTFAACPPTVMRMRGLRSGEWRAEIWDTWAGKAVSTRRVRVGIDGGVRVQLPRIERDLAVKLVWESR